MKLLLLLCSLPLYGGGACSSQSNVQPNQDVDNSSTTQRKRSSKEAIEYIHPLSSEDNAEMNRVVKAFVRVETKKANRLIETHSSKLSKTNSFPGAEG